VLVRAISDLLAEVANVEMFQADAALWDMAAIPILLSSDRRGLNYHIKMAVGFQEPFRIMGR
jgi:hypothetical protein